MSHCGRHQHNTAAGAIACRQKRAALAFDRSVARGHVTPQKPVAARHWPARRDDQGPITVWRFSEDSR